MTSFGLGTSPCQQTRKPCTCVRYSINAFGPDTSTNGLPCRATCFLSDPGLAVNQEMKRGMQVERG